MERLFYMGIIWLGLFGSLQCVADTTESSSVLSQVVQIKEDNRLLLESVELRIHQFLNQMQALKDGVSDNKKAQQVEMEQLQHRFDELLARQQFYDRLVFIFDQKYKRQEIKTFLKKELVALSKIQAKDRTKTESSWQFVSYLALAINNLPSNTTDVLGFIQGYVNFSSVRHPLPPEKYFAMRDYSDGKAIVSAKNTVNQEDLGELIEKKRDYSPVLKLKIKSGYFLEAPKLRGVEQLVVELPDTAKLSEQDKAFIKKDSHRVKQNQSE